MENVIYKDLAQIGWNLHQMISIWLLRTLEFPFSKILEIVDFVLILHVKILTNAIYHFLNGVGLLIFKIFQNGNPMFLNTI